MSYVAELSVTSVDLCAASVDVQSATITLLPVRLRTARRAWPVVKAVQAVARSMLIHSSPDVVLMVTYTAKRIPALVKRVQIRSAKVISGRVLPVVSVSAPMIGSPVRRVKACSVRATGMYVLPMENRTVTLILVLVQLVAMPSVRIM